MARQPKRRQLVEAKYGREGLQKLIFQARSISDLVVLVGWNKRSGSSIALMKQIILDWGLDTTHLRGQGNRPLRTFGELKSDRYRRARLLRERGHSCQVCRRSDWMGKQIPIEIDHIDGDCTNNIKSNLRLICPNCHAQTSTYKGKNIGNVKGKRKDKYEKFPIKLYRDQ